VVGMQAGVPEEGDTVITSLPRPMGPYASPCGMDPKGRSNGRAHGPRPGGYSKGKGGSMHMFQRREEVLRRPMASSAAQVPLGNRPSPFAHKYKQGRPMVRDDLSRRRRRGTRGQVYESFNHGRHSGSCRAVYIIENNKYAMGTLGGSVPPPAPSSATAASPTAFRASRWTAMDVGAVAPPPAR